MLKERLNLTTICTECSALNFSFIVVVQLVHFSGGNVELTMKSGQKRLDAAAFLFQRVAV
jgi:hypothetical protein